MAGATSSYVVGVGETARASPRRRPNTTELAWEASARRSPTRGPSWASSPASSRRRRTSGEGRTISSMAVNEIAGATFKAESKVAADARLAVGYAAARIATGLDSLMIVVAHCKESQAGDAVENAAFDPAAAASARPGRDGDRRPAGSAARLRARRPARVVAAARSRSGWLDGVDADTVAASPETATPLRTLERAPLMDGACALVLCDEPTAARLGRPAVRVAGAATSTDSSKRKSISGTRRRRIRSPSWRRKRWRASAPGRRARPCSPTGALFARELGAGGPRPSSAARSPRPAGGSRAGPASSPASRGCSPPSGRSGRRGPGARARRHGPRPEPPRRLSRGRRVSRRSRRSPPGRPTMSRGGSTSGSPSSCARRSTAASRRVI